MAGWRRPGPTRPCWRCSATGSGGRGATYNAPMDGVRKASAHDIVFQAREGSPELNGCSVNGPRGLGLVSDWALMGDGEGLALNGYGAGKMKTRRGKGDRRMSPG